MESPKRLLTEDDCSAVLEARLGSQDFTLDSYTIEPLSETREGLVGEHFILKVKYDGGEEATFFLKVLNGGSKVLFELAKALLAYEKEEFFYKVLVEQYERRDICVDFAPKCYLCKPYSVVLEYLCEGGFRATPKTEPLDLEHCKAALKTLAKFHSSSIVFEEEEGYSLKNKYPRYFEDLVFAEGDNPASRWLRSSLEAIFELIDQIPETLSRSAFKERLREVVADIFSRGDGAGEFRSAVLHGDLWSNNFLFRYEEGKPVKSKLIDYQILKYGPPSLDVVQFVYTNTRRAFRDEHYESLLDYYYGCFSEELKSKDLNSENILSKEEFLFMCEQVQIPAKLQTLADRSITFLSDETYADALSSEESIENFLFGERSKYIVGSFEKNERFRELITEDIVELRSILFANGQS